MKLVSFTHGGKNRYGAVVEDGVTALVVAERHPLGIAEAITRLAREPDLRQRLGAGARRLVERRFGWERTAEQFEFAYRHALALHSLGR